MLKRGLTIVMTLILLLTTLTTAFASAPEASPFPDAAEKYLGALPWELPEDAERMIVAEVTDGDTARLTEPDGNWWEPYRIIGIQAPETDGPWTDEECYGPEAKEFLMELLPKGSDVYIQRDVTDTDRNDRFLRHLFILDEEAGGAFLVSEVLVIGGYAEARSYPPDDLYDDILAEAQQIADEEDAGLWDACPA